MTEELVHDPIKLHDGYGGENTNYTNLTEIVDRAIRHLKGVNFDTIVGVGMSGAIVIPMLATMMDKHWLLLRKKDVNAHTNRHVGTLGQKWIFLDDFSSTGRTRGYVLDEMLDLAEMYNYHPLNYMGDYMYAQWNAAEEYGNWREY